MQSYDNLKTVVDVILVGKERHFNRRFLALANHYLFEPVACTPASGWEKGQIENQVGNIREWLFTPCPRFSDLAALNAWLAQRCRELANRKHPAIPGKTIAECFDAEQPLLSPVTAPFDGYVEKMMRVYPQGTRAAPAWFGWTATATASLLGGRVRSFRSDCMPIAYG